MDDVTSFAQAAETHLDDVYGYLAWFTGDRFLAEDLAGETFERALRLWHRFDPKRGSARTWLCQVARTIGARPLPLREAARAPRAARRRARALRGAPARRALSRARGGAPHALAGEREVIALRVVLDFDARTAAGMLGISPTNCTTRLNRALGKLEEALSVAA